MDDEPWDELSGPAPLRRTHSTQDPPPSRPSAARHGLPPATAFLRSTSMEVAASSSSSNRYRNSKDKTTSATAQRSPPAAAFASTGAVSPRWSQYEAAQDRDAAGATAQAVYMASSAAAHREYHRSSTGASGNSSVASSSRRSAFEDDDMEGGGGDYNDDHTEDDLNKILDGEDDDDDDSVDSDIGRAYDMEHDNIRQEALRMLEVADADQNYSVHRTITGGFTAQAKPLGSAKPRALQGLNFVAQHQKRPNVGKRFQDNLGPPAARDDYEYGDERAVVDVMGLEARNEHASKNEWTSKSSSSSNNWSSRYSIDNTMLAMSGGAMKQKLHNSSSSSNKNNSPTRSSVNERFSALNLFGSSPAPTPQVFGSGYSFRKQHVFGKQGATVSSANTSATTVDHDNLHWNGSPMAGSNNSSIKTWQEQLAHKRLQQRRWILASTLCLLCVLVPLVSVFGMQRKDIRQAEDSASIVVPADGENGGITFYVTADGPRTDEEAQQLKLDLALVHPTTAFAVHLGNMNNPAVDGCPAEHYAEVAELLETHSPATVFVVPGADDWNNCPDPVEAWRSWHHNFKLFDRRWDDTPDRQEFEVFRQKFLMENWSFVKRGVLFLGIHVVNGNVVDAEEFDERNDFNFRWVMGMSHEYRHTVRAVVVFGNAKPGMPANVAFFAQVEEYWRSHHIPTLYVHSSSGDGDTEEYRPFLDLDNVMAAQVSSGLGNPPLRINVGFGDMPFEIGE